MSMLPPAPKPKLVPAAATPEASEAPPKPKIVSSAFISSGPKKATKKRPAAAPTPPPSGSCRKYWTVGRCEFGDSCKYKHSANPSVPPQAPPPAGACKKFWVDGHCDFGDNCKYPHVNNPNIDPDSVPESGGLTLKKALKMGGRALDLGQWMDPKKMQNFCVSAPSDSVVFHGEVRETNNSQAIDGVDMPSEDIEAELAALQRLVAPQVLAKVQRQLKHPEEDSAAAAAAVHTCTCHLMPGFNAQTGTKLVLCFNCNNAALEDKRQSIAATMQAQIEGTEVVHRLPAVLEEDAPGEESVSEGMTAMAALLDKIDGARAGSEKSAVDTWQEWEKFQQECGFNAEEEEQQ